MVLDMGSYQCKAGYAGEDTPRVVFGTVRSSGPSDTEFADTSDDETSIQ